jgi:IS5 family transposase
MYRSELSKNPMLFPLFHLGSRLDGGNRWLKLAEAMPWEKLDELYGKYFARGSGRPAKDSRLVAGLLTVKLVKNLSDEDVVREFMESPYIQSFCGAEYFAVEDVINPSILSERRKRLGQDFFDFFDSEVPRILKETKTFRIRLSKDSPNAGFLGWLKGLFS